MDNKQRNNDTDQILRSLFQNIGLVLITYEAVEEGNNFRFLDLNQKVETQSQIKEVW